MTAMSTFSGKRINPVNVNAQDICLEDIAHALSLLCRGGGHIKRFYSVGQHSINCAKEAEARQWSKKLCAACLLHDASEAYIADVIRPVKVYLDNYMDIENAFMRAIFKKFKLNDLSEDDNKKWKMIDDIMLGYELKALMNGHENDVAEGLITKPDVSERHWKDVEKEFIDMARRLICDKE